MKEIEQTVFREGLSEQKKQEIYKSRIEARYEYQKKIDKRTANDDLYHFAGLAMQGFISRNKHDCVLYTDLASDSINCAKELIKQLEAEL